VRAARLAAFAALAGSAAVLVPSIGLSKTDTLRRADACGRVEYQNALEAVFGRKKGHQQAIQYRNLVVSRGFVNAFIVDDCPSGFRIVLRGIETFDIGVELQEEARKEGFPVTLECIKAKEIGRYEAVFGHARDRVAANALVNRAAGSGFPGLKLRPDPCGGFEVYLAGFDSQAEAQTFATNARARGFDVIVERN
jgi:hypothetical protein